METDGCGILWQKGFLSRAPLTPRTLRSLSKRTSAFLDQHPGTTRGLARYVNPAASDTLGWGPGLRVLTAPLPPPDVLMSPAWAKPGHLHRSANMVEAF